ncbi:MAG: beta-phosphoglucomutase [Bacilli bacterium]|nr:beta-phosphoglucomutase [Bacilli bacterium]MBN2695971.1 beta-phosphoglucomutase [Bacilli bacterium]
MKLKGIIFDLDGVIVTTDEYHYLAWKAMADSQGIAFDKEKNNRLRGVSRMASLEIVLEGRTRDYSDIEKHQLAEMKNQIYQASLEHLSPKDLLPGVKETLDALRKKGLLLAIGSSSKNTKLILRQVGLLDYFDAIADGTDITFSKPDPEVFLIAASRLNLEPSECAVVEDAIAGIEAAKAGGMLAIAIGDAGNSPDADKIISNINEIIDLV